MHNINTDVYEILILISENTYEPRLTRSQTQNYRGLEKRTNFKAIDLAFF